MSRTKGLRTRYKLYEVLYISKDASFEDIRIAYKKAALRHHPDKGGNPEKFNEIVNAFNVLSDPTKRKMYDESQESTPTKNVHNESSIKRNIADEGKLKKNFHVGRDSASTHTRSEGAIFGARKHLKRRTVKDIEILKGCEKSFFYHFEKMC